MTFQKLFKQLEQANKLNEQFGLEQHQLHIYIDCCKLGAFSDYKSFKKALCEDYIHSVSKAILSTEKDLNRFHELKIDALDCLNQISTFLVEIYLD